MTRVSPLRRKNLESRRDSQLVGATDSGGVATLNHRLIAVMPTGIRTNLIAVDLLAA